ncbi:MAG: biotin-dependent carboxyltransferase family protein [Candidatus Bathyarchaeota archaeon]|nr:biotin-dependent carboxyltransferase family protein [Candidatus Bathyarchaeota archaeon]
MKAFEVVKPGFFTLIEDLGRRGYQIYGVPVSGAMDRRSLRIANMLVGNDEGEAGLEITVYGLELRALSDVVIAVTGGDLGPVLNEAKMPMWQPLRVREGDVMSFRSLRSGYRAYLAVSGGIDVPEVLGSRSTYVRGGFGGLEGRALRMGDVIEIKEQRGDMLRILARKVPEELIPEFKKVVVARVVMGPQDDRFTKDGIRTFLSSEYTISTRSDRMGYRLQGPKIEYTDYNIISDAILRGSIQIPGDGMPLILMSDTGTAGGYAKIATVIGPDTDTLAQAELESIVKFAKVSIKEAHSILRNYEEEIKKLKEALR